MRPVQHLGWWSAVTSKEWDTHDFQIGDVVSFPGRRSVEWTIVGKGATSGLSLESPQGRRRYAWTHQVTLVRSRGEAP